jgi:hypothetical protein
VCFFVGHPTRQSVVDSAKKLIKRLGHERIIK